MCSVKVRCHHHYLYQIGHYWRSRWFYRTPVPCLMDWMWLAGSRQEQQTFIVICSSSLATQRKAGRRFEFWEKQEFLGQLTFFSSYSIWFPWLENGSFVFQVFQNTWEPWRCAHGTISEYQSDTDLQLLKVQHHRCSHKASLCTEEQTEANTHSCIHKQGRTVLLSPDTGTDTDSVRKSWEETTVTATVTVSCLSQWCSLLNYNQSAAVNIYNPPKETLPAAKTNCFTAPAAWIIRHVCFSFSQTWSMGKKASKAASVLLSLSLSTLFCHFFPGNWRCERKYFLLHCHCVSFLLSWKIVEFTIRIFCFTLLFWVNVYLSSF